MSKAAATGGNTEAAGTFHAPLKTLPRGFGKGITKYHIEIFLLPEACRTVSL